MFIAIIPFVVALIGVLMFALCANPKLVRIGEIMFLCGLMATMFVAGGKTLHLG